MLESGNHASLDGYAAEGVCIVKMCMTAVALL